MSEGSQNIEDKNYETEENIDETNVSGNLASPEGVLMLGVAVILDSIGFAIFLLGTWVGIDDYGILDAIGLAIIGGWMVFRGGFDKNVAKKGLRRFITTTMVEICPFLGGASPTWTWFVYKTLKES
jgi:hypothetical protein